MPNRILKESICTSDNIDQLSTFAENFFYRLIVNCDDYGCMDARAKILSAKLYPLKDIRIAQVENALRELTSAELVTIYEVDGKPFLQMNTWERHQQVRAHKRKYPKLEDGTLIASASSCNQMISDDIKCARNPIQSESESESVSERASAKTDAFDSFWSAYPKKQDKQNAKKAFAKLKADDALLQTMLTAIEKQKCCEQWQRNDGQFIPLAATWLNGHRWEDEVKVSTSGKRVSDQDYQQRDYDEAELNAFTSDLLEEARQYAR